MIGVNRLQYNTDAVSFRMTGSVAGLYGAISMIQKSITFVVQIMGLGTKSHFNRVKALNAILFIASHLKDCGKHGLLKALYAAEKKHIAKYGRTICSERIIKMKWGPVSSEVYDMLKSSSPENKSFFVVENTDVLPVGEANLDVFSDSEIDCLEEAIEENNDLNFSQRSDNSHDLAWQAAPMDREMDLLKIAKAGGADENMLQYIKQVLEYR